MSDVSQPRKIAQFTREMFHHIVDRELDRRFGEGTKVLASENDYGDLEIRVCVLFKQGQVKSALGGSYTTTTMDILDAMVFDAER